MAAALSPASPQSFFAKFGSVTLSLAGAAEQMAKDMCCQYFTFVELQTCLCLAMQCRSESGKIIPAAFIERQN